MPRTLYSPRLSDDVVRSLYREGQRRRIPMTKLADELLRQALDAQKDSTPELRVLDHESVPLASACLSEQGAA